MAAASALVVDEPCDVAESVGRQFECDAIVHVTYRSDKAPRKRDVRGTFVGWDRREIAANELDNFLSDANRRLPRCSLVLIRRHLTPVFRGAANLPCPRVQANTSSGL
jgi:hypothetical protein